MNYILNSAVITAPGDFSYRHISVPVAIAWLQDGGWESTMGYQETALALQEITGVPIPVNRKTIKMSEGDEALVFRLVFPAGYRPDPAQKGALGREFVSQNCEIGILRRNR